MKHNIQLLQNLPESFDFKPNFAHFFEGHMYSFLPIFADLSPREKRTFLLHLGYSLTDGLITGILTLNEFVFLKSFHAGSFKLSMLFQLAVLVLPFSIFFTHFFEKIPNKTGVFIRMALFTRLPLILFILFPWFQSYGMSESTVQNVFLLLFLLYYLASPFILPLINQLLKNNYESVRLGKLYSYSWSANMLSQLAASLLFGRILDSFPEAYTIIYPMLGIMGMAGIYMISKIKDDSQVKVREDKSLIDSWQTTLIHSVEAVKENKPFRDFQIGLMIYGVAFLMNQPVVALFLNNQLGLGYSEIAGYKGIALGLSILLFPLAGLLLDRNDPRRYGNWCFALIAVFFLLMMLSIPLPWNIQLSGMRIYLFPALAFIVYGLFTGGITILWGIGSSYFSPVKEVAFYHSIHCSLTGIRGIIAPLLGSAIYSAGSLLGEEAAYYGAFGSGILMLLWAIFQLKESMKKYPLKSKSFSK